MSLTNLLMNLTDTAATFSSYCPLGDTSAGDKQTSINNFINYLKRMRDGFSQGTLIFEVGATAATATLTIAAGGSANDETCVICGVTFTAKTSGATGNQFDISATEATQAQNMVTAFNASDDLAGIVTASREGAVVTLTAVVPGVMGNGLQISEDLANCTLSDFATEATGDDGTEITVTMS